MSNVTYKEIPVKLRVTDVRIDQNNRERIVSILLTVQHDNGSSEHQITLHGDYEKRETIEVQI